MDELLDKTDGKTVFHSPIVFNKKNIFATNTLEKSMASKETYIFMAYPFAKANRDRRIP